MQYDLNLEPYAVQRLEVMGRFFKYVGVGAIRVTTSKGGAIDLVSGQGVWGEEFTSLTIAERSGQKNRGVILAGNYDFRDDTLSGRVEVTNKVETTDGAMQIEKSWFSINRMLSPANGKTELEIVTPAENGAGLAVTKIMMSAQTGNASYYVVARKENLSSILLAVAANGIGMVYDLTKYEVPPGYGLYIGYEGGSETVGTRQIMWTVNRPPLV